MSVLISAFAVLLIFGLPIAFALGLAGMAYVLLNTQLPLLVVFQRMFTSLDSFPFMAIPFFILAGALMNDSGLADLIIDFSQTLVGHLRGGLANVSIVSSMFFGGVSGSAVADASALGSILIPAMKREGYDHGFAAAVNATSSTMGIIIPPSIPMILAGVATGLSIRELFIGGIVPGILTAIGLLVVTMLISRRRNYKQYQKRATAGVVMRSAFQAIPAFIMVAIILGGIMGGIFTPTEASVVAVLYSLLMGLIYRRLTWERLRKALFESAISSAVVMIVISTAGLVTWLFAYSRVPQQLALYLTGIIDSPVLLLATLATILLLAGTVLDVSPGVLLFGPIFMPVITALGIDPVHFVVVMVFALGIGLFTPPVGTTMMISAHIAGIPVLRVAREALPYLLIMVTLLYILVLFPNLVLWLPNLLFR
jgi:tripartite ATP-independent transporter DctM subunit